MNSKCYNIGSLTLCLPLDFHNPLHYSPLRLIFLSNFCFYYIVIFGDICYNNDRGDHYACNNIKIEKF